jgi:hypothetical protein
MKLTPQELSELQYYLDEIRPDTTPTFREDNDEVLDFNDHDLTLYTAKVNVMRENPETKEKEVNKEQVYFLETPTASVRNSTNFSDVCLAAIIYLAAEDIRIGFDLVRQDFRATHLMQEGDYVQ